MNKKVLLFCSLHLSLSAVIDGYSHLKHGNEALKSGGSYERDVTIHAEHVTLNKGCIFNQTVVYTLGTPTVPLNQDFSPLDAMTWLGKPIPLSLNDKQEIAKKKHVLKVPSSPRSPLTQLGECYGETKEWCDKHPYIAGASAFLFFYALIFFYTHSLSSTLRNEKSWSLWRKAADTEHLALLPRQKLVQQLIEEALQKYSKDVLLHMCNDLYAERSALQAYHRLSFLGSWCIALEQLLLLPGKALLKICFSKTTEQSQRIDAFFESLSFAKLAGFDPKLAVEAPNRLKRVALLIDRLNEQNKNMYAQTAEGL